MDEDHALNPEGRKRLLAQLGNMVKSGRVTETEAAQLRAAIDDDTFDKTVQGIRIRHAEAHLDAAVEGGQMTHEEANAHLEKLRSGEHPRSLRAHLRRLIP